MQFSDGSVMWPRAALMRSSSSRAACSLASSMMSAVMLRLSRSSYAFPDDARNKATRHLRACCNRDGVLLVWRSNLQLHILATELVFRLGRRFQLLWLQPYALVIFQHISGEPVLLLHGHFPSSGMQLAQLPGQDALLLPCQRQCNGLCSFLWPLLRSLLRIPCI